MKIFVLCSALLVPASVALAAPPTQSAKKTASVQVASAYEREETLPNRLKFVYKVDRIAPRVALSLQVRIGAHDETAQNAGWRRFYGSAAARGVPTSLAGAGGPVLTSDDGLGLSRLAERFGGEAGIAVGDDLIEFWANGDSAKAPQLLNLLVAMWKSPRLSDADISTARKNLENQLDAQDLDIASQTSAALRTQEFHDAKGNPVSYGLSEIGTTASLGNLTPEKIRALGNRVASSPATLSAVGDVDVANLRALMATLPSPKVAPAAAPQFAPIKAGKPALVVRDVPTQAAWVFVTYPLGHVKPEDMPALRVLSAVLSDIPNARLTKRLLGGSLVDGAPSALSLSSQFVYRRDGSELFLSAQTSAARVDKVKNALLEEVAKFKTNPITASEFAQARDFSRGDWALARQTMRDRAFLVGQTPTLSGMLDGAWPTALGTLTPQKVQEAAKRDVNGYVVALVMPRS